MIPLYFGFDPREEVGAHAFIASVLQYASQPVAFCPLHLPALPMYDGGQRDGTNAFIYSRFLVPELMGWKGWAIFADGCDMVLKADIADLWALRDNRKAVQVVKHEYKTRHPRKYVGTTMEAANSDYPMKNQSSLMLMNCGHSSWKSITAKSLRSMSGADLHRFRFLQSDEIGYLPAEWNWMPQEHGRLESAKLIHYTVGIPAFKNYQDTPMAECWHQANAKANYATS